MSLCTSITSTEEEIFGNYFKNIVQITMIVLVLLNVGTKQNKITSQCPFLPICDCIDGPAKITGGICGSTYPRALWIHFCFAVVSLPFV